MSKVNCDEIIAKIDDVLNLFSTSRRNDNKIDVLVKSGLGRFAGIYLITGNVAGIVQSPKGPLSVFPAKAETDYY